jgi:hypothetical protein
MSDETIMEYVAAGPSLKVDVKQGVIRGVKVLGLRSKNGREYLAEALRKAAPLYRGCKVHVDHPPKATGPRSYRDRIGHLENVQVRPDGLYADLKYNPKHDVAGQLAWDAEHSPGSVGLSHNINGTVARRNGKAVVESITKVVSVDLVADPATTRGLFESVGDDDDTPKTTEDFLRRIRGEPQPDPQGTADFRQQLTGQTSPVDAGDFINTVTESR